MSQVTLTEKQIIEEGGVKVVEWARYNSAYTEFQKLRDVMIRDIMQMEILQGADFYSMLQKKIRDFKQGETLKRIARSVVTGQALNQISQKNIQQNVKYVSQQNESAQEEKNQVKQQKTIQDQIEEANKKVIIGQIHKDLNKGNKYEQVTQPEEKPQKATQPEEKPQQTTQPEEKPQKATQPEEKPQQATQSEEKPQQATQSEEKPQQATQSEEKPQQATQSEEKPQQATQPEEKPQQATIPEEKLQFPNNYNQIFLTRQQSKQFESLYEKELLPKLKQSYKNQFKTDLPNKGAKKKQYRTKLMYLLSKGKDISNFQMKLLF